MDYNINGNDEVEQRVLGGGMSVVKKLNPFIVLQVLWIIEIYYLGLNAIMNSQILKEIIPGFKLPSLVQQYNCLILNWFNEWEEFVLFLAIGMLICGFMFAIIRGIPSMSQYKIINSYCVYGVDAGT